MAYISGHPLDHLSQFAGAIPAFGPDRRAHHRCTSTLLLIPWFTAVLPPLLGRSIAVFYSGFGAKRPSNLDGKALPKFGEERQPLPIRVGKYYPLEKKEIAAHF